MKTNISNILDGLNDSQKKVVTTIDGPVLVAAGPGTGKTLTIVRRIAYLIQQGVKPENILAVTFTNRAAREMRERTGAILGEVPDKMFIGTFHILGLKILRDIRSDNFVICNRDEQLNLLRPILKKSGRKLNEAAEKISRVKSLVDDIDDEVKGIYEEYQSALMRNSALDFDDLILHPVETLGNNNLQGKYRDLFRYIIVDEYQDINPAQYKLLRLIAGSSGNICAVGDSDQAIYAFRGADIENFLHFEKNFEQANTIHLTENYRSTTMILNASYIMIKNNLKRIARELNAVREKGSHVTVISVPDEKAEGTVIVREIEGRMGGTSHYQLMHSGPDRDFAGRSYCFSDFAVIFRTNAQMKAIEEAFLTSGIPYQVVGGHNSLQAKATEDILAYLRSLIEPSGEYDDDRTDPVENGLLTPADFFDPSSDAVTLMTLHMAKGLEFRVAFITGVEDGLIPYTINKNNINIEEERRLFYVGMTRAEDELFMIHARKRFLYGQKLAPSPSPFIKEIPEEYIQRTVVPDRVKRQKENSQIGVF
jgi:superfamily I DNA/RNA helicase